MYHSSGPRGAHFRRSSQRDQLPRRSSSSTMDMGHYFQRIRRGSTCEAERRAAKAAQDANVPPARLFLRSTSRGLRRVLEIYMPRFQPDEEEQRSEDELGESARTREPQEAPPIATNWAVVTWRTSNAVA
ncbi:uncharacterized protein LOC117146309 [Drosophila mauritiana]|uniref:Uncharacterized protein LOC117146309 n=1 Tax=Drosophila mauritiana TaxID=7226 RepID=A0A6P8KWG1_DROMA|nr:uncharacterized protein LOC117146309 [Drosophila mauritiana]